MYLCGSFMSFIGGYLSIRHKYHECCIKIGHLSFDWLFLGKAWIHLSLKCHARSYYLVLMSDNICWSQVTCANLSTSCEMLQWKGMNTDVPNTLALINARKYLRRSSDSLWVRGIFSFFFKSWIKSNSGPFKSIASPLHTLRVNAQLERLRYTESD